MKKQLIKEAFRMQQLAGIQPVNSLKEEFDNSISQELQAKGVRSGVRYNVVIYETPEGMTPEGEVSVEKMTLEDIVSKVNQALSQGGDPDYYHIYSKEEEDTYMQDIAGPDQGYNVEDLITVIDAGDVAQFEIYR